MTVVTTGDDRHRMATGTRRASVLHFPALRLPLWLCVIQAILAYEWLVSGLDKLLDRGFSGQLSALLTQGAQGTAGSLYGAVIAHLALPNHTLFTLLIPWTETSIGGIMLLGAILWTVYPSAHVTDLVAGAACLALLTAATLDLNYYLLGGGGLPWIDPANATEPGINVDVMLLLVALALGAANAQTVLQRHPGLHAGAGDSVDGRSRSKHPPGGFVRYGAHRSRRRDFTTGRENAPE
jgi:thiosulfate dehydrogenase [quinone] large subunit